MAVDGAKMAICTAIVAAQLLLASFRIFKSHIHNHLRILAQILIIHEAETCV